MCLPCLLLSRLECLIHTKRRLAANHSLLFLLFLDLLQPLLSFGLARPLPMKPVRKSFPGLLRGKSTPELIVVDNVDIGLVIFERLRDGSSFFVLPATVFVLSSGLVDR